MVIAAAIQNTTVMIRGSKDRISKTNVQIMAKVKNSSDPFYRVWWGGNKGE